MRRGCMSLGETQCDECHRIIPYPDRYLIIEEAGNNELRLCTDCCIKKGYVNCKQEKGIQVTTFFVE